jgi:hypothetical protein
MAAKYTTAFADLQKFNKQDAIRQGKEKETKLADFKCQEDELRQQKLELQAKEAMLERLRDAQRKEEEALAVQKKAMRSKEIRLEAERRKLLGLGDCPGRVDGGSALKRRLSHKSEPEKKGDAKRRLHVKRETKAPCIQGIKLEKEGPKEEVDMERSSSEFDEESEPQCISRCEQCHESFDSNDSTHHFCFGHPGMPCYFVHLVPVLAAKR